MKTIKVGVATNRVGSDDYNILEVDDSSSDEYIEKVAYEAAMDMVDWYWEEIEEENK